MKGIPQCSIYLMNSQIYKVVVLGEGISAAIQEEWERPRFRLST